MEEKYRTAIEEIRRDKGSGATMLKLKARDLLDNVLKTPGISRKEFYSIGKDLVGSQPSMASIFSLVNLVLIHSAGGVKHEFLTSEIQMETDHALVADLASNILKNARCVVALSFSSTVHNAILGMDRPVEILCSEGRPAMEGRSLAASLATAGNVVTLVHDAALPGVLEKGDIALVGSDAVTTDGFLNKIGTYPLCLACRDRGVPLFVPTSRMKFLPEQALRSVFRIRREDPKGLWDAPPKGVVLENFYFEWTPHRLVDSYVTEDGLVSPKEIGDRIASVETAPEWES